MSQNRLLVIAVVLWEAYWAYVFVSAPDPDEKMSAVFALMMGGFPLVILALFALYRAYQRLRKRVGRRG
jgi:hypothetical protein